jgi:hypothetical protein
MPRSHTLLGLCLLIWAACGDGDTTVTPAAPDADRPAEDARDDAAPDTLPPLETGPGDDTPQPPADVEPDADAPDAGDDAGAGEDAPVQPPDAGPVTPPWEPPFADAEWTPAMADGEGWIVPPDVVCRPAAGCADTAAPAGAWAGFRRDYWLPQYSEDFAPAPTMGGRMQGVMVAGASGAIDRIEIEGVDPGVIYVEQAEGEERTQPPFDWFHVWPRQMVEGEPLWVAFHTRADGWQERTSFRFRAFDAEGSVLQDTVLPVASADAVFLSYVGFSDDRSVVLVHARNVSDRAVTLDRLVVNGLETAGVGCRTDTVLEPGTSALWEVPLCEVPALGTAWTVVAEWDDGGHAVGVGRVLPSFFPVEAWNNTTECPFPGVGGNAEHYARMREAGFDTMYTHEGVCGRCGCDTETLFNDTLPGTGWFSVLTANVVNNPRITFTDTRAIAAVATGDESDGRVYEQSTGVPRPAEKARDALQSWLRYPELPTFNGGMTNRNIGAFAGMVDIQGMDHYMAACAPHITPFGQHPPPRGPYDYLVNTRNNHMPNPTWLYTQGLALTWNQGEGERRIFFQPDRQELLIQALSVVAAGGKGIMWFQSWQQEAVRTPARWEAIAEANRMVRAVRGWLRVGDPTGEIVHSPELIAEVIRAPQVLVVPVINLAVDQAVDDNLCILARAGLEPVPHWIMADNDASIYLPIPEGFAVADVFEVTGDGVRDAAMEVDRARRLVRMTGLGLSNEVPVRLFVLASSVEARAEAASGWTGR